MLDSAGTDAPLYRYWRTFVHLEQLSISASGFESHMLATGISDLRETGTWGYVYNLKEVGQGSSDTYSKVIAKAGATVVMEDRLGVPLLTYATDAGGVVVHINDGMAYGWRISDNMHVVVGNSVSFAVLTEPSGLLLLAFGILLIFKRRSFVK